MPAKKNAKQYNKCYFLISGSQICLKKCEKKCTVWRPIIIINNNQIYNDMKNISISKKKKPIHQDRIAKKKE